MINRERYVKQPSAGSVSWNTDSDFRGVLEQVAINPSSTATTYDFKITADDNTVVYQQKGRKGTWIDDTKIGMFGVYTLDLENASDSTKSFTVTLIWNDDV